MFASLPVRSGVTETSFWLGSTPSSISSILVVVVFAKKIGTKRLCRNSEVVAIGRLHCSSILFLFGFKSYFIFVLRLVQIDFDSYSNPVFLF